MSKIHIGKNGPAPCRANKGKCPLGGVSGSDNHFNTMTDAEAAYAKQQGGAVKSISKNSKTSTSQDYARMFSDPTVRDNIKELQEAFVKTNGLVGFGFHMKTQDGSPVLGTRDFTKVLDDPNFNEEYSALVNSHNELDSLNRFNERTSKKLSSLSFEKALPQDIQEKIPKIHIVTSALTPEEVSKIEEVASTNSKWKKEFAPIAEDAKNHKENLEKARELYSSINKYAQDEKGRLYSAIYNNKLEYIANGAKSNVNMGGKLSPQELNAALKTINGKNDMPELNTNKLNGTRPGLAYSLALDVHEQNSKGNNIVKDIDTFTKSSSYKDISKEFGVTPREKGWSRIAGSATSEKELREIYSNPEAKKVAERIANDKGRATVNSTLSMDRYLVKRLIDEKGVDGAMKYLNDGFDKKESLHTSSIALNLDDVMDELNFKSVK